MAEINKYVLALDLSTTNVGIALYDEDGVLKTLKHLKLETDKQVLPEYRYIVKATTFIDFIKDFKNDVLEKFNANIATVLVEEPLIMSNNSFTSAMLQKFNGICCYLLYQELNIAPELISVHEARKGFCPELVKPGKNKKGQATTVLSFPKHITDKKMYIFEKVANKYKDIEWFYNKKGKLLDENFDMADAVCVGESYFNTKKNK